MANENRVAFADGSAVTVHVKLSDSPSGKSPEGEDLWDVESKVLAPGDYIELSKLPPYLSDAVKAGKVPFLVSMTLSAAKKRLGVEDTEDDSDAADSSSGSSDKE
jgi:hypothetical protein